MTGTASRGQSSQLVSLNRVALDTRRLMPFRAMPSQSAATAVELQIVVAVTRFRLDD